MTDTPARISASQVRLILERAAEIDARGDSLTVEELRQIADEAGIDRAATETAIQEITAGAEETPPPTTTEREVARPAKSPGYYSPPWIAAGGAVGMVLGFLSLVQDLVGLTVLGAVVLGLILRAVEAMKKRSHLSFQLENLAVWFGLAVAGIAGGVFAPEMLLFAVVAGIVLSVVGGLIVAFGSREEEPEDDVPRIGPGE